MNGPTTLEVAEQRERRVLIQMSVLVLAFLIFWLPFWTLFATLHLCHFIYLEVSKVITPMYKALQFSDISKFIK